MTPGELESAGEKLFGENWKGLITDALGIDASTRWRMLQRGKIPGPVAAAVTSWLVLHRAFGILPPIQPQGPFRASDGNDLTHSANDEGLDIRQMAEYVFGEHWKTALSDHLGVNYSTLWRQMDAGEYPAPVIVALRAWKLLRDLDLSIPNQELKAVSTENQAASKKSKSSKYAKLMN